MTHRAAPHRAAALVAVGLVALLVTVGVASAATSAHQTSAQASRVCAQSQAAIAALPAPSTAAAAQAGLTSWLGGKYSSRLDSSAFSPLPTDVFNLESSFRNLRDALGVGDGPGATDTIGPARRDLTQIDAAARQRKLPACTSAAFGRAYLGAVQAMVASTLALTGDFATDANAACRRFDTKAVQLQRGLNAKSASSLQTYLKGLEMQYEALGIDLAAVKPPPGQKQQYSTFVGSIHQAIGELTSAGSALSSGNQTKLAQLGRALDSLGGTVNQEAKGLGLIC